MTNEESNQLDITYLISISNNETTFIKEVLRLFIVTSKEATQKLESDLINEDYKSIEFILHRMRSSIMPFNLTKLNEHLKSTEEKIASNNYKDVSQAVNQIILDTKRIISSAENKLREM
jgi:HPt (histidine-containing phosphotransfer) domain-containing protein